MAFGFGFNKQKVLSAAEKFVQQGKLPNAIAEYEKVLKADPKDLTVANTVGDLYARLGQSDKAVECFKSVGDAYATQGFTVKAIAMYKKLSKLKASLESVLRLAELYTQQGLFNDARAQYLQVAEEFLRAGELEQAVRIFQKTLEMDPENVAMRMRLAEVYIRLGKKTEAWQIFSSAAESLRSRGSLAAAEDILQRMLTLDPGNSYALLLRGRNAIESGDVAAAIKHLEKVADLDTHPDGLRTLLQAYLQTGRLPEAGTLAAKLFTVHNDTAAITGYADALMAAGQFEEALQIYQQYCDRLLAADSAKVLDSLHSIIGHVRENAPALETLLELLSKAGETTHVTEVYELLAHAYVQSGELDKARDYYLKLTQLEPENQLHTRNYQQVLARLGGTTSSRLITAEEGAVMVDELEATAPFIDQRYPDDVAIAVRAALTDAELFVSYNMPAKALGPLLSALPKAAQDLRLNQRLAALHTRAGRFAEAAVCSRTLETIYHDAGHPDEASRYGELAAKYEERSSTSVSSVSSDPSEGIPVEMHIEVETEAPAEDTTAETVAFSEPVAHAAPVEPSVPAAAAPPAAKSGLFFHAAASSTKASSSPQHAEFDVQADVPADVPTDVPTDAQPAPGEREIDLSDEWEGALSTEPASPAAKHGKAAETKPVDKEPVADEAAIAEIVEEIRFYLKHSMADQATAALAKLEKLKPGAATLAAMRSEIADATAQASPEAAEEVSIEEVESVSEPEPAAPSKSKAGALNEFVSDLESSLGEGFAPAPPAQKIAAEPKSQPWPEHRPEPKTKPQAEPQPEPQTVEYAAAVAEPVQAGALGEFVADLEASLGDGFLPEAPAPPPAPAPPASRKRKAEPAPVAAKTEISIGASVPPTRPVAIPSVTGMGTPTSATAGAATAPARERAAASPTFTYSPTPIRPLTPEVPAAAPKPDAGAGVDLADMFGELKHELEEDAATTDEDPETHYNLGVAFREMGLLDEAIGELQKVCQAVERGHSFPQVMQTYTWLAQCFLDKGVPEAAIRWYEQALKLPEINAETRTALHYELATSFETAGNKPAALSHFMEVYGSNIDYRDVSERIKALKS